MAVELTDETKEALEAQGGIEDDKATGASDTDKDTPEDIDLHLEDTGDTDEGNEAEESSESTDLNKTVDETLKDAGFDVTAIAKEITDTGKISDELIAKAKEKLDPDLVDAHVQRLKAEIELTKIKASKEYKEQLEKNAKVKEMNDYVFNAVGGEDKFKALGETLKGNMSKEELGIINAKLLSGNKALVNEGLKSAVTEYKKAKGLGGKLMEGDGDNTNTGNTVPHITKEDFRAITGSDKFKTDPIYRDKMQAARLKSIEIDKKKYGPGTYYGFGQNGRYEL